MRGFVRTKVRVGDSGLLYTAKGAASLLVPLSSVIAANFGGWSVLFVVIAVMNIIAAVLALAMLKPMRARLSASGR